MKQSTEITSKNATFIFESLANESPSSDLPLIVQKEGIRGMTGVQSLSIPDVVFESFPVWRSK